MKPLVMKKHSVQQKNEGKLGNFAKKAMDAAAYGTGYVVGSTAGDDGVRPQKDQPFNAYQRGRHDANFPNATNDPASPAPAKQPPDRVGPVRKLPNPTRKESMEENTINFIKHVTNNNFKQANDALAAVVNEKIKQRIAVANQNLSTSKGNN